jgi:hypothetical protein
MTRTRGIALIKLPESSNEEEKQQDKDNAEFQCSLQSYLADFDPLVSRLNGPHACSLMTINGEYL